MPGKKGNFFFQFSDKKPVLFRVFVFFSFAFLNDSIVFPTHQCNSLSFFFHKFWLHFHSLQSFIRFSNHKMWNFHCATDHHQSLIQFRMANQLSKMNAPTCIWSKLWSARINGMLCSLHGMFSPFTAWESFYHRRITLLFLCQETANKQ